MSSGTPVIIYLFHTVQAQTTDYQTLLSTFAEGLYTELDFRNEALNAARMQTLLAASEFAPRDVIIPKPYMELTTRSVPC